MKLVYLSQHQRGFFESEAPRVPYMGGVGGIVDWRQAVGKVVSMKPKDAKGPESTVKGDKVPPPEYTKVKKLPKDYAKLVAEYFQIVAQQALLEKQRKSISEALCATQMALKQDRILFSDA